MHYFLTGGVQVGKSTIIKRLVRDLGLDAGGFMTRWVGTRTDRVPVLLPYGVEPVPFTEDDIAAVCKGETMTPRIGIFDTVGPRILGESAGRDVIIMDELGSLESRSYAFQKAVLKTLDGDTPVLGVIQPRDVPFLNGIRSRPDVTVITVDEDNRDSVFSRFAESGIFKKSIQ